MKRRAAAVMLKLLDEHAKVACALDQVKGGPQAKYRRHCHVVLAGKSLCGKELNPDHYDTLEEDPFTIATDWFARWEGHGRHAQFEVQGYQTCKVCWDIVEAAELPARSYTWEEET